VPERNDDSLRTLVLVHSPLVGPLTWESTAACLRRRGYRVVVPSLAGVADGGPPYYPRFAEAVACAVADAGGDGPMALVGHSGAGALLPAIAEAVGDDVQAAVFVDALLPHPKASWFETAPAPVREHLSGLVRTGWLPPWNEWFPPDAIVSLLPQAGVRERFVTELPRLPVAYFEEPAPAAPKWSTVRCAYVRLSEAYDRMAKEAEAQGWWVHRENLDHLAMLTQPSTIADAVAQVVEGM
jgi:pimeloyl-ACP methyl ester carboxylesterase